MFSSLQKNDISNFVKCVTIIQRVALISTKSNLSAAQKPKILVVHGRDNL